MQQTDGFFRTRRQIHFERMKSHQGRIVSRDGRDDKTDTSAVLACKLMLRNVTWPPLTNTRTRQMAGPSLPSASSARLAGTLAGHIGKPVNSAGKELSDARYSSTDHLQEGFHQETQRLLSPLTAGQEVEVSLPLAPSAAVRHPLLDECCY